MWFEVLQQVFRVEHVCIACAHLRHAGSELAVHVSVKSVVLS